MAQNDLNANNSINYTQVLSKMSAINVEDDWTFETLEQTRELIQRIIVPCVVTIGIAGNLLTVIVLTR